MRQSWGWDSGLLTQYRALCFLLPDFMTWFLHMNNTCHVSNTQSLLILTSLRDRDSVSLYLYPDGQPLLSQANFCKMQLECNAKETFLWFRWQLWVLSLHSSLELVCLFPPWHPSYGMVIIGPMCSLRLSFLFFWQDSALVIILFLFPLQFHLKFCFFGILYSKRKCIIHQGTFDRCKWLY